MAMSINHNRNDFSNVEFSSNWCYDTNDSNDIYDNNDNNDSNDTNDIRGLAINPVDPYLQNALFLNKKV